MIHPRYYRRGLILFMLVCMAATANAQLFRRRKARVGDVPPKAILVELMAFKWRLDTLHKRGWHDVARKFKAENDVVVRNMAEDFAEYFNYCPVYFFIDSNANKVMKQEFDGVLLDRNLKPLQQTVISPGDSNYYIVNYTVLTQSEEEPNMALSNLGPEESSSETDLSLGTIMVHDPRFRPLKEPLPRTAFKRGKMRDEHHLRTRGGWIGYNPLAYSLSKTLHYYFD